MPQYRCLNLSCRRVWESQLPNPPIECPWCGSTNLIEENTFQRICRSARMIATTPLGIIPSWDAFLAILEEFGLTSVTPRFRRALLLNVLLKVEPNAPLSSVVGLLSPWWLVVDTKEEVTALVFSGNRNSSSCRWSSEDFSRLTVTERLWHCQNQSDHKLSRRRPMRKEP